MTLRERIRAMTRAQRWQWLGGGGVVLVALVITLWPPSPNGATPSPQPGSDERERAAAHGPSREAPSIQSPLPHPSRVEKKALTSPTATHEEEVSRRALFKASFGEGADDLGISHPPEGEGEVEGPSSFVKLADGTMAVLDSQKKRILWYDSAGRVTRSTPVALSAPADIIAGDDGGLLVLDRWRDQALLSLDGQGEVRARVALDGLATVDGMYAAEGLIYVEEPGGLSRPVATVDGQPAQTQDLPENLYTQEGRVPGHVSPDGEVVLSAAIDDRREGQWSLSAISGNPPNHRFSRQYDLDTSVLGVDIAGIDQAGTAYVTYTSSQEAGVVVLCVDMDNGVPLGKVTLPPPERPVSMMRALQVLPEGGVVYANSREDGISYELFDCR